MTTYAPASRTSGVLVPDTEPNAMRSYPHELHCNADRYKPLGCDMCSCKYGRLIKARDCHPKRNDP